MANEAKLADQLRTIMERAALLPPPEGSVVYFIGAPTLRHIKIGHSANIVKRLLLLQTGNPSPLTLLAYEVGGVGREFSLHRAFENDRGNGEWFFWSRPLLQYVEARQSEIAVRAGVDLTLEEWSDHDV